LRLPFPCILSMMEFMALRWEWQIEQTVSVHNARAAVVGHP